MRLIDADALMKKIREVDFVADIDLMKITHDSMLTGFFHGRVQGIVDYLPTAYDPDKVAEEVREVADRIHNYCEEIDWHIPEEERTGYEMLTDIWKLSEIVKKGGVADET